MRLLLPLLLLASCTTVPTRSAYRQSAFVPVEAPSFEPSQDAPHTTGMPGYVGSVESLPRSPHGRVLPQTPETRKEPGLWAVHDDGVAGPGIILGVAMPPMDGASAARDFLPSRMCSAALAEAIARAQALDALARLALRTRTCVAATLHRTCLAKVVENMTKYKAAGVFYDSDAERTNNASLQAAVRFESAACEGVPVSPDLHDVLRAVLTEWRRTWK